MKSHVEILSPDLRGEAFSEKPPPNNSAMNWLENALLGGINAGMYVCNTHRWSNLVQWSSSGGNSVSSMTRRQDSCT